MPLASVLRFVFAPSALLITSAALAQQPESLPSAPTPAPAPLTRFKLGLDVPRLATGHYSGFSLPLYAGLERQLGSHWSFTTDANFGIGTSYYNRDESPIHLNRFGLSAGARYYYGQARRLRKGKPVTALNGFYVQAQGSTEFYRSYSFYDYDARPIYRLTPSAELLWGYQRSLGRHGFLDAGAGLRAQRQRVYDGLRSHEFGLEPVLRVRVGLAL